MLFVIKEHHSQNLTVFHYFPWSLPKLVSSQYQVPGQNISTKFSSSTCALHIHLKYNIKTSINRQLYSFCNVTWIFIVNEFLVILVDAEVSDVNIFVLDIRGIVVVRLRGESHEAVLVQVNFQRTSGGHEDVYTEIELESIDQKWSVNVFLNHSASLFLR